MAQWKNGWMETKSSEVRLDVKRWMNTQQIFPVLLCHCSSVFLPSLFFTLSLFYSGQMSNSCGAVAWLINALRKPREVEHNKQTEEGEGSEWGERLEREEWDSVCEGVWRYPPRCHSGFSGGGTVPPHHGKASLFSSLEQSCLLLPCVQSGSSRVTPKEHKLKRTKTVKTYSRRKVFPSIAKNRSDCHSGFQGH